MQVLIGTPSYYHALSVDYHVSAMQTAALCAASGIVLDSHIIAGGIYLGKIRNTIVDHFLTTQADALLFIDADVGWDAKVIPRILNYEQEVVAGLVPKRDAQNGACFHQNALTGVIENGLFQSLEAPTAFMRIKRSAFERLEKPYFKSEESEDNFGEDIYFCRKWCALGEYLWIDSDIEFSHRGTKAWQGNFYEHAVKSGLLQVN
jgi:hypothetical protein